MNKSETKEVAKLEKYRAAGADRGLLARAISDLIRASSTNKSSTALKALAKEWGVTDHPDYII